MTDNRMFALLGFEVLRHRVLAKMLTEPEVAAGHEETAAALERAMALLECREKMQPKQAAVHKCSRYGLRKGSVVYGKPTAAEK